MSDLNNSNVEHVHQAGCCCCEPEDDLLGKRFCVHEEAQYRCFLWEMFSRHFRLSLVGGALLYLVLSWVDYFLFERAFSVALNVRMAATVVTLAAVGMALIGVRSLSVHLWVQAGISFLVMATVEWASVMAPHEFRHLYMLAMLLGWMFAVILMRLPLRMATWLMVISTVMHAYLSIVVHHESLSVCLVECSALLAAGLMLGAGSYFLDKGSRDLYIQLREVRRQRDLLKSSNALLEQKSFHDSLTGLHNRRSFEERFDLECRRAARLGARIGVMVIDVDAFKQYNDSCGHLAGDDCLRRVATILSTAARRSGDLVARFGGEEFVVVWPDSSLQDVYEEAERLRRGVEALAIFHPKALGQRVTISIGVACHTPSDDLNALCLFEAADTALYRAKHAGRNQVDVEVLGVPPASDLSSGFAFHFMEKKHA